MLQLNAIRTTSCALAIAAIATASYADDFSIDGVHSSALFKVNHLGATNFYGAFTEIGGSLSFDPADVSACSVEVSIKTDSVATFNQGRDNHLKGPDFFNAKQFPEITFKSAQWEKAGDGKYKVTGELGLHGKTKTLTVDVMHTGNGKNPRSGKDLIGFETEFTIDRTEFDMNYGVAESGGLGKDVTVIFSVEAVKQ